MDSSHTVIQNQDQAATASQMLINRLRAELPLCFTRQHISRHLGGLLSSKALAMLDHRQAGPQKLNLGRRVAYERESFLNWLEKRLDLNDASF